MDYAACNVVYVDRTAQEDRLVRREDATSTAGSDVDITPSPIPLERNLQTLLGTFSEGIFNSSLSGNITDFLS
jgi:3',5'-cyclic-nucleotide phosphodiesterase